MSVYLMVARIAFYQQFRQAPMHVTCARCWDALLRSSYRQMYAKIGTTMGDVRDAAATLVFDLTKPKFIRMGSLARILLTLTSCRTGRRSVKAS
jgi:hypothetical protein